MQRDKQTRWQFRFGGLGALALVLAACVVPIAPAADAPATHTTITEPAPITTIAGITATDKLTTAAGQPGDATVQIDSGLIQGVVSGDVLSFKGIPYAAPPVGDLRWRAPQPVTPWTEVRPATAYGLCHSQRDAQ